MDIEEENISQAAREFRSLAAFLPANNLGEVSFGIAPAAHTKSIVQYSAWARGEASGIATMRYAVQYGEAISVLFLQQFKHRMIYGELAGKSFCSYAKHFHSHTR